MDIRTTAMAQTYVEPPPASCVAERPRHAFAAGRDGEVAGRRWWLWPHLLSLDAPLVAVVWQDWWGRAAHETPAPAQRAILGLGVWLIYLADRLADNARGLPEDGATARHAFARAHRLSLTVLAGLIAVTLAGFAPTALPAGQFRSGLVLLAAAGAYFWLIHRRTSPRWTRHLPKEAVVGGMFAAGTAFFVFCRVVPTPALLGAAVAVFGIVCFLNCALITSWERNPRDRRDPASFLNAFPSLANGGLRVACWWLALAAGAAGWGWHTAVFAPLVLAAAALAAIDLSRHRFSADALRCLVDLVLLTPCVCLGTAFVVRWVGLLPSP